MVSPERVLAYLAALVDKPKRDDLHWNVVADTSDLVWFDDVVGVVGSVHDGRPAPPSSDATLQRLVGTDALRDTHMLRGGVLWLAGRVPVGADGAPSTVCLPIFERTVRFVGSTRLAPVWVNDLRLHPTIAAHSDVAELLTGLRDRLRANIEHALTADVIPELRRALAPLGLDGFRSVERRKTAPTQLRRETTLTLVPGAGVYLERSQKLSHASRHLHQWGSRTVDNTAFAAMYDPASFPSDPAPADDPTDAASVLTMPLNARQREIVGRARTERVVAVSGPPGTGKSHVAIAIATQAVAAGRSVLIATKSDHAAESLCELLERHPTPPFLRFGSNLRRAAADELGTSTAVSNDELRRAQRAFTAAADRHDAAVDRVFQGLTNEANFHRTLRLRDQSQGLLAAVPAAADPDFALERAEELLDRLESTAWWHRLRHGATERRLRALLDARPDASRADLAAGVRLAEAEAGLRRALEHESRDLDVEWSSYEDAEEHLRGVAATMQELDRSNRLSRHASTSAARSAAALGSALRSGSRQRSAILERGVGDAFLDQAPLWVGTLDEIEDTLPATTRLFDIVIFDEASQIDQPSAAGALCRAHRAVVVGDPQQLRHVSFVANDAMAEASEANGIDDPTTAQILDVRRNSLFDVAASASAITMLDEHFRCAPHLIQFSASRFYDARLRVMTQHPRNEGHDCIHAIPVAGERDDHRVVTEEVEAVKRRLRVYLADGARFSLGIVTPFRAQADALEAMALDTFTLDEIRSLDLRIGTVHGMQGTERDVILISPGLGTDDLQGQSLRFLQDPHLFNVMVTRAKLQIELVHAYDADALPPGVLRDWMVLGDHPPSRPDSTTLSGRDAREEAWTAQLASELEVAGLRVVRDYPVAGWTVDIAVGEGEAAFGVETGVHPDGIDTHFERYLTLRRAGWDLTECFESRWLMRSGEAVSRLAAIAEQRARAD